MRRGGRILIVLGLILGAITAGGTFLTLSTAPTAGPQIATKSIVVAFQNIPERTEITAEAVGKQDWPENALPAGAIEKPEDVIGKLALQPIYPGQVILPPMIVDKNKPGTTSRSNASFLIPDGKVAVAFPLNELSSVAGAVQAGDTVDLLLTLSPGNIPVTARTGTAAAPTTGTEGLPITQIMLQDVPVAQVGAWTTTADKNAPAGTSITFIVDRQDALALKSAREQGQIELALRHAGDHKTVTTEPVSLQYLNKRFNFNLLPPVTGR